jgi:hypothetical protein
MRMTFKVIVIGGLIVFLAVVTAAVFIPDRASVYPGTGTGPRSVLFEWLQLLPHPVRAG